MSSAVTTTSAEVTPTVTDRQLAEMLQIGLATLYRWKAQGRLPRPLGLGKVCRYLRAEVDSWMRAGCPCQADWEKLKAKK